MGDNKATVIWQRADQPFADGKYSRAHIWRFDGGVEVPASSSPAVVPKPMSIEAAVDPEEAYVASLSSCHMLTFLWLAQKRGFIVDRYHDDAVGVLARNADGRQAVTVVTLRPRIAFSGSKRPSASEFETMHHEAHEQCFIAQSVKTEVRCDAVME